MPISLLFSALIASAATTQSESDPLPRRGYFGVGLEKAEGGVGVFAVTPALLAAVIVHDIVTMRKLYRATVLGIAFPLGLFLVCTTIGATDVGLSLVRWLQ